MCVTAAWHERCWVVPCLMPTSVPQYFNGQQLDEADPQPLAASMHGLPDTTTTYAQHSLTPHLSTSLSANASHLAAGQCWSGYVNWFAESKRPFERQATVRHCFANTPPPPPPPPTSCSHLSASSGIRESPFKVRVFRRRARTRWRASCRCDTPSAGRCTPQRRGRP